MEKANNKVKETHESQVHLRVDHLMSLCMNDKEKLNELITFALPVVRNSVVVLNESFEQDNIQTFLKEIHKIKGSLGVLEPEILYPEAKALELEFKGLSNDEKRRRASLFVLRLKSLIEELHKLIS